MDRFWLLTWTTYGTWLPGDARGFVGCTREGAGVHDERPKRRENDVPGTDYEAALPKLEQASHGQMPGDPVRLTCDDGSALLEQLRQTASVRGWTLLAAAIMSNHVHLVVGVPGDPEPADLLRDFKSYGSRRLTERNGAPNAGTWWTKSGSKRKLPDEFAVQAAIEYVKRQHRPLTLFCASAGGATEG